MLFSVAVGSLDVIPLLYAAFGDFKTTGQILGSAAAPDPVGATNYIEIPRPTSGGACCSFVVALITVVFTVVFATCAAFVFARFAFRGRELVYTFFTLGLLFPIAVAILPLFVLLRTLGLLGNPLGVALPQAAFALPLTIVILRPFFGAIPNELEDAARVDGCSTFGFLARIVVPLSRPALATVAVLALVTSWNAFLLPLLVFQGPAQWTLPLGVMNFSSQYASDWARILAYTTLAMVPAVVFYAIAERQIVSGLTAGSVKG